MMSDPRTPKRYYVTEEEHEQQKSSLQNSLQKLRTKLDDLVGALDSYKEKRNASPAAKKIADNEEDKAARIRYLKRSKENAEKFVESVIPGDTYESI